MRHGIYDCNKRSIFYCSTDGNDLTKWLRQCTVKFPKGFMIVTGFCYNGKLKIRKVSSKAKSNSVCYQQNILEPIFTEEIPVLYGKDIDKAELLMDKAPSHTSESKAAYLEKKKKSETGVKCIPFDETRVKSPYASPKDFCVFLLIKRALGKRHPKTLNGLWKTVKEEWSKTFITVIRKSLFS
ncbi:uncharacterized protein TNCV_4644291 [Trichonephila clavipes]|nr:uncharacterized protein TNCV_4644291 [Trichonephila clavipes]